MAVVDAINGATRRVPAWPLYVIGAIPPIWYLYLGMTGGLGVEPIEELEHRLGELGLQMLIVTLLVTPIRDITGIRLVKYRRALGLLAFSYILLHLLVWLVLDVGILSEIWADIVKRPYITIGMAGFACLVPLAATSNDWSIRKLGPLRWRKLHMLSYAAVFLGALHYVMLVKGWQYEPLVYMAIVVLLLGWRLPAARKRLAA